MKKMVKILGIVAALAAAGYIGFRLYEMAIKDATKRIKQGVSQGVSEGIGKGVGGVLNPFK